MRPSRTTPLASSLLAVIEALEPEEQVSLLRALTKLIHDLATHRPLDGVRMCASCRFFRPCAHPETGEPHHCTLVAAPFDHRRLRMDCLDHQVARRRLAATHWTTFARGPRR